MDILLELAAQALCEWMDAESNIRDEALVPKSAFFFLRSNSYWKNLLLFLVDFSLGFGSPICIFK